MPMQAILYFPHTITAKNISFSLLADIPAYIFPPQQIIVWASDNGKQWKVLGNITPQQPTSKDKDLKKLFTATCTFRPTSVRYIKFEVQPVQVLPQWFKHRKKDKGWAFVDEVLVN